MYHTCPQQHVLSCAHECRSSPGSKSAVIQAPRIITLADDLGHLTGTYSNQDQFKKGYLYSGKQDPWRSFETGEQVDPDPDESSKSRLYGKPSPIGDTEVSYDKGSALFVELGCMEQPDGTRSLVWRGKFSGSHGFRTYGRSYSCERGAPFEEPKELALSMNKALKTYTALTEKFGCVSL
jgi:hypothetical protein